MAVRRRFSVSFKRQVVEELLAGGATTAQLCRRYELCPTVLRNWKQQYAQGLLGELGIYEITLNGKRAVAIPYHDAGGNHVATRFRLSLDGAAKFRWRSGSRTMLYGLRRLVQARERGYVIVNEGESDTHTCWAHDLPAVGIPGAETWKERWAAELDGIERIYCVIEPDRGGETLRRRLAASSLRSRVLVVDLNG